MKEFFIHKLLGSIEKGKFLILLSLPIKYELREWYNQKI